MRRLFAITALLATGCSSNAGAMPVREAIAPQIFQKHVNDYGWMKIPLKPIGGKQPNASGLAVDADNHKVWASVNGGVDKIRMNGAQQSYPLAVAPGWITVGSDGNLWGTTNDGVIVKVTPAGVEQTFTVAASDVFFANIISGPDGALWFPECKLDRSTGGIGRLDTSGSYTFYPSVCQWVVANGPDGNIWFGDQGANIFEMTTQGQLVGTYPVGDEVLFSGLTAGSDGAMYAVSTSQQSADELVRVTTSGKVTHIGGNPFGDPLFRLLSGPDGNIWISAPRSDFTYLAQFDVATQTFSERIRGPKGAGTYLVTGPDGNIWTSDYEESSVDIYVLQLMTVTPNKLVIGVGKQASFKTSELNYGGKWTAISTKPSVATVTRNSQSGTFVVTGIAAGVASIFVSDTMFNSIAVEVTVTAP
jgi:streptogramin lyase